MSEQATEAKIKTIDDTITDDQAAELAAFLAKDWTVTEMPIIRSERCETVDQSGNYPKVNTRRATA